MTFEKKKIPWELIIISLTFAFSIITWIISEKRYSDSENKENLKKEAVAITGRTTLNRLKKYRLLIHTKRENEYYELYENLKYLVKDSSDYMDNDFKNMIGAHMTMLQMWSSRDKNNVLPASYEQLYLEHNQLVGQNRTLYYSICTKYNCPIDMEFFENVYLY